MPKAFDPSVLFQPMKLDPRDQPYPTDAAAFDAVRAGKKGMCLYSVPISELEELSELLALAFARDLVVVLDRSSRVFIARREELWRVPAYEALWSTAFEDGTWTNAAAAQESHLLGYTAAQRKKWLATVRSEQAAWGHPTVYALLTLAQRKAVAELGGRCFGDVEGMTLFRADQQVLRRDALRRVPKGLTLARAALGHRVAQQLFPRAARRAVVPRRLAAATNAALASNVQFLTRSGWKG